MSPGIRLQEIRGLPDHPEQERLHIPGMVFAAVLPQVLLTGSREMTCSLPCMRDRGRGKIRRLRNYDHDIRETGSTLRLDYDGTPGARRRSGLAPWNSAADGDLVQQYQKRDYR